MNFLDYIKKHFWYIFGVIIFIIGSGLLLSLSSIKNATQVESQEILLFNISLNNWGIWITIIGALLASIWAMYQYTKSTSIRQHEKASEIAKIFSDDLLNKCSTVIAVYQNSPLNEFILKLKSSNYMLNDFNTEELREIFKYDDFPSDYKKLKSSIDFDYIYFRVLENRITVKSEYKEKYDKNEQNKAMQDSFSTTDARNLFILENLYYPFHFSSLVDEVLNKLEYVCISLSTHAAGSSYIYQSLHQTFFDTVETLFFEISLRNNGKYSDKFYTNIIHVYKEWKKIYRKSMKNEEKEKNKKKRTLNPKIRTVE